MFIWHLCPLPSKQYGSLSACNALLLASLDLQGTSSTSVNWDQLWYPYSRNGSKKFKDRILELCLYDMNSVMGTSHFKGGYVVSKDNFYKCK
ncbi:hypothetical protein LguiA_001431 [Lonicera macranthoides]